MFEYSPRAEKPRVIFKVVFDGGDGRVGFRDAKDGVFIDKKGGSLGIVFVKEGEETPVSWFTPPSDEALYFAFDYAWLGYAMLRVRRLIPTESPITFRISTLYELVLNPDTMALKTEGSLDFFSSGVKEASVIRSEKDYPAFFETVDLYELLKPTIGK